MPHPSTTSPSAVAAVAWYTVNSSSHRHAVGLKAPNDWGLYDRHGNVWEICLDRRANSNDSTYWMNDGHFNAGSDVVVDPVGTSDGITVAARGGGYNNGPENCRSAQRYWIPDSGGVSNENVNGSAERGYRLVCPIPVTME